MFSKQFIKSSQDPIKHLLFETIFLHSRRKKKSIFKIQDLYSYYYYYSSLIALLFVYFIVWWVDRSGNPYERPCRQQNTTLIVKNFCRVMAGSARHPQPYCYISTDVAEEALMASRADTDVQVIHVMGSHSSPKLLPQLPLLLCSSCAVCNLETVAFGSLAKEDAPPCLTNQWLHLIKADHVLHVDLNGRLFIANFSRQRQTSSSP